MANNFRQSGFYYVSKWGSDANSGTSPETPFATISRAIAVATTTRSIVIGAGTYEEAFNTGYGHTLTPDGLVVLKGNSSNALTIQGPVNGMGLITIQDYATVNLNAGFAAVVTSGAKFQNINTINFGASSIRCDITSCIFINIAIFNGAGTNNLLYIDKSILINVTSMVGTGLEGITNSYTNGATQIRMRNRAMTNCNIMGSITKTADNTNYDNLAAYQASVAASLVVNCFNLPPLFNNVQKGDFTLQANSPHIAKATDGGNIGGTSFAKTFTAAVSSIEGDNDNAHNAFLVANGAEYTNLVPSANGQDLIIANGFTEGSVRSGAMAIAANPQALNAIGYLGFLLYNRSQAGGSANNKNVPDGNVYYNANNGIGGANPDRLTLKIRTSTKPTKPAADVNADWDNNGYAPAGMWLTIPWNETPAIDTSYRGNGEPDFNAASSQPVTGMWLQVIVTLTNKYTNVAS
jgi:hypothetical protein